MTRTNEKLAEKIAKEEAEDTRPQWEIDREKRDIAYDGAANLLLDEQIQTLKFVMKHKMPRESGSRRFCRYKMTLSFVKKRCYVRESGSRYFPRYKTSNFSL